MRLKSSSILTRTKRVVQSSELHCVHITRKALYTMVRYNTTYPSYEESGWCVNRTYSIINSSPFQLPLAIHNPQLSSSEYRLSAALTVQNMRKLYRRGSISLILLGLRMMSRTSEGPERLPRVCISRLFSTVISNVSGK